MICGVNFSLYYQALKRNIRDVFKDQEFRFYITVIVIAIVLITINIYDTNYSSIGESLRYSSFQVVTIISTTGYSTADFDQWPTFSKIILFALMFFGGCAGSTSGSIKNMRIMLLLKIMRRELMEIIHPRAVYSVRMNGKNVDEEVLSEVLIFFFMYMCIFAVGVLLISFDGKDVVTTVSSVAATLGNIGPGFAMVGPTGNFSVFSDFSKIVLSFCMIIGRLEIYPILLLLIPSFWRKGNI